MSFQDYHGRRAPSLEDGRSVGTSILHDLTTFLDVESERVMSHGSREVGEVDSRSMSRGLLMG